MLNFDNLYKIKNITTLVDQGFALWGLDDKFPGSIPGRNNLRN